MKIKYRRFDDNDYTEVECIFFKFEKSLGIPLKDKTSLIWFGEEEFHSVYHVCEVCIEEI